MQVTEQVYTREELEGMCIRSRWGFFYIRMCLKRGGMSVRGGGWEIYVDVEGSTVR